MNTPSVDVLAVLTRAIDGTRHAINVDVHRQGESLKRFHLQELLDARDVAEELIDFVRYAECCCVPETEKYAAHTCRRCRLLANAEGARA